jgi:murein DD-endopeptidase MepM/ murein hydrolase activator NlpD
VLKTSAAAFILLAFAMALPGRAAAVGDPEIAALQVGLRAQGLYAGTVDGVLGGATQVALVRFQRRAGLAADGVVGPRTRAALGRYGRRGPLGNRRLVRGDRGWDVAALQFVLAWHGFPSGPFDAHFGSRTDGALRRFQSWAGLKPNGTAGASTIAALRGPLQRSPIALSAPMAAPYGDGFGPRGLQFHGGLDFVAPVGSPVAAAGSGRVVFAGLHAGGWGNLVVVAHASGVRTLYAHLSRVDVRLGRLVRAGGRIGLVGATGRATGPHLHFEVRVRGAAVDPATAIRPD